jgi:hypothetical protein
MHFVVVARYFPFLSPSLLFHIFCVCPRIGFTHWVEEKMEKENMQVVTFYVEAAGHVPLMSPSAQLAFDVSKSNKLVEKWVAKNRIHEEELGLPHKPATDFFIPSKDLLALKAVYTQTAMEHSKYVLDSSNHQRLFETLRAKHKQYKRTHPFYGVVLAQRTKEKQQSNKVNEADKHGKTLKRNKIDAEKIHYRAKGKYLSQLYIEGEIVVSQLRACFREAVVHGTALNDMRIKHNDQTTALQQDAAKTRKQLDLTSLKLDANPNSHLPDLKQRRAKLQATVTMLANAVELSRLREVAIKSVVANNPANALRNRIDRLLIALYGTQVIVHNRKTSYMKAPGTTRVRYENKLLIKKLQAEAELSATTGNVLHAFG